MNKRTIYITTAILFCLCSKSHSGESPDHDAQLMEEGASPRHIAIDMGDSGMLPPGSLRRRIKQPDVIFSDQMRDGNAFKFYLQNRQQSKLNPCPELYGLLIGVVDRVYKFLLEE